MRARLAAVAHRLASPEGVPRIQPSARVRYASFGFLPNGGLRHDLYGRLIGHRNLIKRLQARDLIGALDIQPSERVLDFGCGVGFLTVELAKLARSAVGIDPQPSVRGLRVPRRLDGRLHYVAARGEALPLEDAVFDRVLASEVLPMSDEPIRFLREIRRVLVPGGVLVVCNGLGHPSVESAYSERRLLLRLLARLFPRRFPKSYDAYCAALQNSFGTRQRHFLSRKETEEMLQTAGFCIREVFYSPGALAGAIISWEMFVRHLRTGGALSECGFPLKYLLLSALRPFERQGHRGGLICVAERLPDPARG